MYVQPTAKTNVHDTLNKDLKYVGHQPDVADTGKPATEPHRGGQPVQVQPGWPKAEAGRDWAIPGQTHTRRYQATGKEHKHVVKNNNI